MVAGATPAQCSSRTAVSKPARRASKAVALTQWSVARPTTSTASTSRSDSHDPSGVIPSPAAVPSKPV